MLVEAGCGTGASVYPLLRANPALFAYAFDVSAAAVGHLVASPEYAARRVSAAVHDAAAHLLVCWVGPQVVRASCRWRALWVCVSLFHPNGRPGAVLRAAFLRLSQPPRQYRQT